MDKHKHLQGEEQLIYARILEWGTRAGFVALVAGFVLYVFDPASALVAPERLPALWTRPVAEYLAATHAPTGWDWLRLLRHGDVAALLGIVVLAACPALCLLPLLPRYFRSRDWGFFGLVVAQLAVMAFAASGLLTGGH